jgi:hypothetical protein
MMPLSASEPKYPVLIEYFMTHFTDTKELNYSEDEKMVFPLFDQIFPLSISSNGLA